MRQSRTYGSAGALGGQPPGAPSVDGSTLKVKTVFRDRYSIRCKDPQTMSPAMARDAVMVCAWWAFRIAGVEVIDTKMMHTALTYLLSPGYQVADNEIPYGGVAFEGTQTPEFDNVKIGYDNNNDGDIADAGDDIVWDEDFASTSETVSHDHAGNLIDDGDFVYIYDGWNRLVKVRASNDADVAIQTAEFDALGRRIKKVVENSGDLDATVVYLYDGQKIIETHDGSGNLYQQFIHGTRYIDELVMVRVKDKGDFYVYQAERDQGGSVKDWNVIGLTDLGGGCVTLPAMGGMPTLAWPC